MTTRLLLEQALEALDNSVDLVYEEYTDAVRRYEIRRYENMPTRKAKLDGLAVLAKEHDAARYAIRAELAKPAKEAKELLSHAAPEDGLVKTDALLAALAAEAQDAGEYGPAWHDEPSCAGIWVADDGGYSATTLNNSEIQHWEPTEGCRWFGPIPEDTP